MGFSKPYYVSPPDSCTVSIKPRFTFQTHHVWTRQLPQVRCLYLWPQQELWSVWSGSLSLVFPVVGRMDWTNLTSADLSRLSISVAKWDDDDDDDDDDDVL